MPTGPNTPARPRSTLLAILLLWLLFYASFTLFHPALLDDADSVHAEVAREMLLHHDYVTLYANGIRYLEKAPLLYWSMAASMKLFGVSAAAARLPLAFTVLALAFAIEAFARRLFASTKSGLYAALITLSSFGIFLFTRITIPDAAVCLWITVALYAFWRTESLEPSQVRVPHSSRFHRDGWDHRLLCYTFAAACAFNILTKGLIGIVFPIAIVGIYLLLTRGIRGTLTRLRQLHPLTSLAVFLCIAAPWHILAALHNPTQGHPAPFLFASGHWQIPLPTDGNVRGWLWFYFMNEHLLRYLNLRVPRDYDTFPLTLFWGLLLLWLMPWSVYLFKAIAAAAPMRTAAWRASFRKRTLTPLENSRLLLILWAAIPMLFFSFSTRQEYYVLPALPALILLIAGWLAEESHSRAANRIAAALLSLGSLAAAVCTYFIFTSGSPTGDITAALSQNPADYALSLGHFLDLTGHAMAFFRLPLAITSIALIGATLANFLLRKQAKPHAANLALAAGAFTFLLAAHLGLQTFAPVLTSAQLAQAIAPQVHPEDLVAIHGEYESGSTLGFYLKRNDLHILEGRSSNLWYGSFFPDAPHIFETPATLAQKWPGPQRIFLWQSLTDPPNQLPTLPGPIYVLAQSGGKEIVSNQPNR